MSGIKNKVVAITGAGGGVGSATALLLAQRGAKIVLGDLHADSLATVATRITEAGDDAAFTTADVTRQQDLANLVALARDRYGQLDALVNNAGVGPVSPLDDLRVAEWDLMVDVNIKGVLYGIAAALPVFREQGFGQFVNIASTAAYTTVPSQAVYSGTKSAVRAISEGLRKEAGDKLRVTIVSPGFVRTNFVEAVDNVEVRTRLIEARDKLAVPPEAIARTIAFAIEQPPEVDVNELVVRPTAQS